MSDFSEISDFEKDLLKLANDTMPRETSKFLKKNAKGLVKVMKATAKKEVSPKTGTYFKRFKAGKVYSYNGDLSCRAYNSSTHAHLIEYGHIQKNSNGETFVKGKEVLKKASSQYENEYFENSIEFIDEILEKGLAR